MDRLHLELNLNSAHNRVSPEKKSPAKKEEPSEDDDELKEQDFMKNFNEMTKQNRFMNEKKIEIAAMAPKSNAPV